MTRKQKRFALIGAGGSVIAIAVALVLVALQNQVTYFYGPSDLAALPALPTEAIRVGGLVAEGSVDRTGEMAVAFTVTDTAETIRIRYEGLLPDLFREGQGVVIEGRFAGDGVFEASQVLAKHDETYMPPEVADALKKQGVWKDGEGMGEPSGY